MTDLVEHRRGAEQTLGVYCLRASDMVALLDEIERLRAALQQIAAYPHSEEGGEMTDEAKCEWDGTGCNKCQAGKRLPSGAYQLPCPEVWGRRALEPKP